MTRLASNISRMTLAEVNDELQIIEYIDRNEPGGLNGGDRKRKEKLERRKQQLLRETQQITIGKYKVCLEATETGDLQIRVYPIDDAGNIWDCPFDTLDVLRSDVTESEILAAEEDEYEKRGGQ